MVSLDTGRVLLRGTSLRRSAGGMAVQGRAGGRPTAARGRKAQLRVCTFANRSVGASLIRPWLAHAPTALQEATFLLSSKGIRVLSDEPKIGAHGKPVVFLHPKDCGGVLVELKEA